MRVREIIFVNPITHKRDRAFEGTALGRAVARHKTTRSKASLRDLRALCAQAIESEQLWRLRSDPVYQREAIRSGALARGNTMHRVSVYDPE